MYMCVLTLKAHAEARGQHGVSFYIVLCLGVFKIYLHLCVLLSVCIHIVSVCLCAHMSCGGRCPQRPEKRAGSSRERCLVFWDRTSHWTCRWPWGWTGWPESRKDPPASAPFTLRLHCYSIRFLHGSWGSEFKSSCLYKRLPTKPSPPSPRKMVFLAFERLLCNPAKRRSLTKTPSPQISKNTNKGKIEISRNTALFPRLCAAFKEDEQRHQRTRTQPAVSGSNTASQWKTSGVPFLNPCPIHISSLLSIFLPSVHTATKYHFYHVFITNQMKSKQVSKAFCYNNTRNFQTKRKTHLAGNNRWKPPSPVELISEETSDVALIGYQTGHAGKFPTHQSTGSLMSSAPFKHF